MLERIQSLVRRWRFTVRAKQERWAKFWQQPLAPGGHDLGRCWKDIRTKL